MTKGKAQLKIAGTQTDRHEDIEGLALSLRELRKERMDIQKDEDAKAVELIALMTEHNLTEYRMPDEDPPLHITVEPSEIKVHVTVDKNKAKKGDDKDLKVEE